MPARGSTQQRQRRQPRAERATAASAEARSASAESSASAASSSSASSSSSSGSGDSGVALLTEHAAATPLFAPNVVTVPLELRCEARLAPTKPGAAGQPAASGLRGGAGADRQATTFRLELAAPHGCEEALTGAVVRAVRFELHPSFAPRATETVKAPPFALERTCWAENLVTVKVFFRDVRDPAVLTHLVRVRRRSAQTAPPSGKQLDLAPPPPVVGDVPLRGPDDRLRARNFHAVVVHAAAASPVAAYARAAWGAVERGAGENAPETDGDTKPVEVCAAALDERIAALEAEHVELFRTVCDVHAAVVAKAAEFRDRLGRAEKKLEQHRGGE